MTMLRRRDPEFLVERLLPRHLLSATRNAALDTSLRRSDRAQVYAACVDALLDLSRLGLYVERPSADQGTRVFASTTTGDRIHLTRHPRAEQQASRPTFKTLAQDPSGPQPIVEEKKAGPGAMVHDEDVPGSATQQTEAAESLAIEDLLAPESEAGRPSTPSASLAPQPAPLQDAMAPTRTEADTLARLEGILGLAGIEARLTSLAERLRHLLTRIEGLFPGAQAAILHLEGATTEELGNGPVRLLTRNEVENTPHYEAALRRGDLQFATTAPAGEDPAQGTLAAVAPLRVGESAWGLLEILWPRGRWQTTRQAAPLLQHVARLAELAIQNQQTLEKLVFVDPLTGVYNRVFYDRQLSLEMERAHRTSGKFGLLVMDVDDFKSVNDRHGHRAGDQVLAAVAQEVRERMRKIDLLFRYGGEEFVLLLPGADGEETRRTAERLRAVVSERRFEAEGAPAPLRVTVSLGGAIYPDDARTATGLFRHADNALYRAKEQGKNRVAF